MPLLLSPEQIALGQYGIRPIVTPSGTQGIFLQNVSSLSITVNSRLGSVQIPPAFVVTLPMDENDQITFEAIPSGINFPSAFPQYVDVSYSFVPVAPAGTGLFIVPTTGGATPAVEVAITGGTASIGSVSINGATVDVPTDHESTLQLSVDSTTTPLAANGTYTTATAVDISNMRRVFGTVISDQAGTLYVRQSSDAANWDIESSFTVAANDAAGEGVGFSVEVVAPYAQLYYVNGATAQTVFRLYAWAAPEA